jgi:hypothetical protein
MDESSQAYQKKKYGLIAQDLQKVYPDLVYEDQNGYLSVDYVGIIPLLIQSIKQQQSQIENLNQEIQILNSNNNKLKSAQGSDDINASDKAMLYQNTPNPFNQTTEIKYYLPKTVTTASLIIYNMQGNQLKQIQLTTRANGSETISASEFSAGMYLYALLADGKEIDVKRMILTK